MSQHTPGPWVIDHGSPQGAYMMPCGCSIIREIRSWRGDLQYRFVIRWCAIHGTQENR